MLQDITIKITDREGVMHQVQAPTDMNLNLMELIRMYELAEEGTIGVCGGMAMCATCQVYIESPHELREPNEAELDMLDQAFFVKSNSRLGCQLFLTEQLEGLVVRLCPEQE